MNTFDSRIRAILSHEEYSTVIMGLQDRRAKLITFIRTLTESDSEYDYSDSIAELEISISIIDRMLGEFEYIFPKIPT